ncbi:MAG: glycosyltransferase [Acidobacteria bacterium]|nr:glycosyltransferase [Acidobacteriaceae bacterium]MBV9610217.1 glycosyltransferase [Acidobacteriota bacterium]
MPKITAIIHACNDAQRLPRVIESLRSCDEVLVVNHGSEDNTEAVARDHGAKVKEAILGVEDGAYAVDAAHDWVFCLQPSESLSESLEASLLEWKRNDPHDAVIGFRVEIREQNGDGWHSLGEEMRLVNRKRLNWTGTLPPNASNAEHLSGDVLRFTS